MRAAARLLAVGLVVACGLVAGPAAEAAPQQSTQRFTIDPAATAWTDTILVDRFDPAIGDLTGVDIRIAGVLEATAQVENTTDAPVSVTATATAHLRLARAGSSWSVEADPTGSFAPDLDAYDGTTDYDGASGLTRDLDGRAEAALAITTAADLDPFEGVGTIALELAASGAGGTTGAPVASLFSIRAGAEVEVTYTFLGDERPPDAPTITAAPAAFTNDLTPTIAFVVADDAAATTSCRLERPGPDDPWGPCTSPWTVTLPSGTNGTYALSVRATDPAGNTGGTSTAEFVVDTNPPAAPSIATTPVSPSSDVTPAWSFSTDADTTTTCQLDGLAPVPCAHSFTADLHDLADGTHTFHVVATDAAGNIGPVSSSSYVLDRVAPAPPAVISRPSSPSPDPTPTWTVGTDVGATLACAVDGGPFIACDATHTVDLTAALDGDHTLAIRATDAAGNAGEPTTEHYRLDRAGPAAPDLTGPTVGNDPTPTFTFTGEPGAHFACQLDLGGPVECDGGTFEPLLTIDAVYVVTVWGIDAAGNLGAGASISYRLDTVPPPAPTITGRPPEASPDDQPTWTFAVGLMRTAECAVDGGPWVPCADAFTADLDAAPDGLHEFAVRAIDRAGNVGEPAADTFVLDRAAPAAPVITSSPVTPGRDRSPSWTFEAPPDSTTECSTDGSQWDPCADGITVEVPDGITDVTIVAQVRARDGAGNTSAPVVSPYTLDLTAPAVPLVTSAPVSPDNRTSATWTFTVDADAEAECAVDGGAWVSCNGGLAVLFGSQDDGRHTVEIRATDTAGNVSEAATGEYVLDTTPPPAPIITSGPASASTDDTPTWSFLAEDGSSTECRIDDGPWLPCLGTLAADLGLDPDGTHAMEVRATDAVGNTGPSVASAYLLDRAVPPAPELTAVPPTPGNDRSPAWTFSSEEGTATECSFDDGPWEACEDSYEADLDEATDGPHVLAVRTTDLAGNRSDPVVGTYELDTTPPVRPAVTGPSGLTNDATPEWQIDVEAGSTAECSLDGEDFEACGSLLTATLADGPHQAAVRAVDAAGNTSVDHTVSFTVDTVPPPPPTFSHLPTRSNPTWGIVSPDGSLVECSIDGGPWLPCSGEVGGESAARLDVRSVDAAGNRSAVVSVARSGTDDGELIIPSGGGRDDAPPPPPAPRRESPPIPSVISLALPAVVAAVEAAPVIEATASAVAHALTPDRPETALGNLLPVLPPEVALLIQNAVERSTLPAVLIGVVIGFVAIQDRIDRRDPKLAHAPLRPEPEYLEFK